ncbi:MAG TPA: hypothetical protein PKY81_14910 [bacterium]|nr:hypothetical protein [bacterium]
MFLIFLKSSVFRVSNEALFRIVEAAIIASGVLSFNFFLSSIVLFSNSNDKRIIEKYWSKFIIKFSSSVVISEYDKSSMRVITDIKTLFDKRKCGSKYVVTSGWFLKW